MLDEAGFHDTTIVASNDLDEHIIASLKNQQDAKVNVWGVGTKLVTAYDQPALGGVYKISAIKNDENGWDYKVKLSEQAIKISNPGIQQVKRYYSNGESIADMIYNEAEPPSEEPIIIDPMDATRRKKIKADVQSRELLEKIFDQGKNVYKKPAIADIKNYVQEELGTLHSSIKRFANPHQYPVGLEKGLFELKNKLVLKYRGNG